MLELRNLLYKATKEEDYIAEAILYIENNEEKPPFSSYVAMLTFIKAKYLINPLKKLKYFKKGCALMEEAVRLNSNDIETRFLRLSIQYNIPHFLDYNKNKKEYSEFIKKHLKEMADENLKSLILQFFKENKL